MKLTQYKRKKPVFQRQDSHKKTRVKARWRRARGLQSKIRLAKRGYRKKPKTGYGSSKKEKIAEVASLNELKKMAKGDKIIIKSIGLKKKIILIEEANKSEIKILNIKTEEFLKKAEDKLKQRKEQKKKKIAEKASKKEEANEKSKEKVKKEKIDEKIEKTEEELKKEKDMEKKEKEKLLIKKE